MCLRPGCSAVRATWDWEDLASKGHGRGGQRPLHQRQRLRVSGNVCWCWSCQGEQNIIIYDFKTLSKIYWEVFV